MKQFVRVTRGNINDLTTRYDVIVCSLRSSREKAMQLAVWELWFVFSQVDGIFIVNGPLGDIGGQISFFVAPCHHPTVTQLLKTTGYAHSFYELLFHPQGHQAPEFAWKGVPFSVAPYFKQDKQIYEESSPHNREFLIYDRHGEARAVTGYRGDGSDTGRRGLPVEDARLLVNLVSPQAGETLLDPFAGSGGILWEARSIQPELTLLSGDIERSLEPGLSAYADIHYTMDARRLPLAPQSLDAIVTEVPFARRVTTVVAEAFLLLSKYLTPQGKIAFMCDPFQYEALADALTKGACYPIFQQEVDRQGTGVVISLWYKNYMAAKALEPLAEAVHMIY